MIERAPIHLGSGEPMLLLHPFMMSQNVWKYVAPLIAETGRYEVFAPTMPGHNGGVKGPFFLDSGSLADDVERRMDALGWDTAHVVGNSLRPPGLQELAEGSSPTPLVTCEKDRVLPHPRFTRHFTTHLPKDTQITHLDGVGHIPMFEAPRRVTDLIVGFADRYATPPHKAIG